MFKQRRKEHIFLILLLTAAAAVRGFLLFRDLEYDEIWSLEKYAILSFSGIFSDLSTPNNHPVNTLLIKFLWFSRENFWSIRLGSVIFSLGTILLLWQLGRKLFSRTAAWYAATAGAFLPPLVIFGVTARGYAGEIFFLLLFALALINCRKGSIFWSMVAAASGLLAVISLPTSVLYIAPLAVIYLCQMIKKRRFKPLSFGILLSSAVLAGVWFIINWQKFICQKQFKEVFTGFSGFFHWFYTSLSENGICLWLLIPAIFFLWKRKLFRVLMSVIFFPLAAAVFTSPAPARVYLPCSVAGILLFATGFGIKKWRYLFMAILLTVQIFISYPDRSEERITQDIFNTAEVQNVIKIYPPAAGYVLRWNHPESVENFFRQLQSAAAKEFCALLVPDKEKITGFSINGDVAAIDLPFSLNTVSGNTPPYILFLQKTASVIPNRWYFAIYPPMPKENMSALYRDLKPEKSVVFNQWLRADLTAPDGKTHRYMIFAFQVDRHLRLPENYPCYIPLEK